MIMQFKIMLPLKREELQGDKERGKKRIHFLCSFTCTVFLLFTLFSLALQLCLSIMELFLSFTFCLAAYENVELL